MNPSSVAESRQHKYFSNLMKPLRGVFVTTSVLCLAFAAPVMAQQPQVPISMRTITVSGRGTESIPTTLTLVRLGVEVQGKTAAEVQQEAARRSSAVVALLKTRNVERLETTGITLNPVYSYTDNTQRLTGYSATNIVSFRIATERIGNLLDEAVKAGATRIDSVSFIATDSAIAQAQQQALREATQDAQQQANAVLNVLNLSPSEVVSIQINNAGTTPPPPIPLARQAAVADSVETTPVVGGEQQVEATVTLQIRY
ncbi:SIMPL domain-containing protein [Gloeocapsopsis sp. IPPAS B-1203]|uniref:SIMPL domain-containing protein n=1 Tax=Gloeocapsopsis sp. IPPAS B-1203 TaxID=2049454 RepID=UPI0025A09E8B|nr:SIMPL domain-containing protein [Gloeocapsopsis sp. IPPAS B-1203]